MNRGNAKKEIRTENEERNKGAMSKENEQDGRLGEERYSAGCVSGTVAKGGVRKRKGSVPRRSNEDDEMCETERRQREER